MSSRIFYPFVFYALQTSGLFRVSQYCTYVLQITITGNASTVQPLKNALQNSVSVDNAQGNANLTSAFALADQTFTGGSAALKV